MRRGAKDLFGDHLPLMRPWIDDDEITAVAKVLQSGWISQGKIVDRFEQSLAELVGAPFGVATNSATTALHLAFQVSGLRPGDKVVLPAHTCMATANGILMAGGVLVFADIDLTTFNLDPGATEEVLDEGVRAICLVHQIGLPADLEAFSRLARSRDLLLVEDAATALGATFRSDLVGGHGHATVFSFHPRKMITTGEGGLLALWDAAHRDQARRLRSGGVATSDLARHRARGAVAATYPEPGFNYRLTDLQAAIGLAQLRKLPGMLQSRRRLAERYTEGLRRVERVVPPVEPADRTHCFSSYCIRILEAGPDGIPFLVEHMAKSGISCRRGIQPLYREPAFAPDFPALCLPNTEIAARETMFLPIFPQMSAADQDRVIDALLEGLAQLPHTKASFV